MVFEYWDLIVDGKFIERLHYYGQAWSMYRNFLKEGHHVKLDRGITEV